MAILHLEELEAFIKWVYLTYPDSQYSTKTLQAKLNQHGVDNSVEDIRLLHEQLYENDFSLEAEGYSYPAIEVVTKEDEDDEDFPEGFGCLSENALTKGQLYGQGLDDFYREQAFR